MSMPIMQHNTIELLENYIVNEIVIIICYHVCTNIFGFQYMMVATRKIVLQWREMTILSGMMLAARNTTTTSVNNLGIFSSTLHLLKKMFDVVRYGCCICLLKFCFHCCI